MGGKIPAALVVNPPVPATAETAAEAQIWTEELYKRYLEVWEENSSYRFEIEYTCGHISIQCANYKKPIQRVLMTTACFRCADPAKFREGLRQMIKELGEHFSRFHDGHMLG